MEVKPFRKVKRLHLVGIGGVGMSGIAEILLNMGYQITGSDLTPSPLTQRLSQLGAGISYEHRGENVEGADVVVISSAIKESNPEVEAAHKLRIPLIRRAEMLGELMRMKFGIAIAGTHGKTTTTSMIGEVMTAGGFDPTIVVGGRVKALGTNALLGKGDYFVAEADEFDRSFLRLIPTIAVITTLEAEHMDCYTSLQDLKSAFVEFANRVPFYGSVILCLDEPSLQEINPRVEREICTYGLTGRADVRGENLRFRGSESLFVVYRGGEQLGEVKIRVPGEHNVKNALAAVALGLELGIPFPKIASSLQGFRGVHRRFEIKGEKQGIIVVDDYAHHPTEIEATLRAARAGWKRRILTVFQPHLYSRTRDFCGHFGRALSLSDLLVITEIYPAREEPIEGVSGKLVAEAAKGHGHKSVHWVPRKEDLPAFLAKLSQKGDMVITMGAGDIWITGEKLLEIL